MIGFAESLGVWAAVTFLPAFAGLLIMNFAGRVVRTRYLAAFALGIFMWFFVDTIGGAANLDVSQGFAFPAQQIGILVLFSLGVLAFFAVDNDLLSFGPSPSQISLFVPLLVALAVGFHGFGEGSAFGNTAASSESASLIDTFGGISAGVAYALHKALEPMIVGAVYVAFSGGRWKNVSTMLKDVLALSLVFVVPSLAGAAVGYSVSDYGVYFYGLGTGAAIYAALRLARAAFSDSGDPSKNDSLKFALFLLVGFLCIYGAALLHA